MGLFSNVSNFVEKKLKEKEERKKEDREIAEIRNKALHEERIKAAPILAKKQAALEVNQKIANIKAGKGSGGFNLNLQNLAHDIGQSTGSQFNKDFDNMFGGGPGTGSRKARAAAPARNAFDNEFDKYFRGKPAAKKKARR
jgi:hypothetical protein